MRLNLKKLYYSNYCLDGGPRCGCDLPPKFREPPILENWGFVSRDMLLANIYGPEIEWNTQTTPITGPTGLGLRHCWWTD